MQYILSYLLPNVEINPAYLYIGLAIVAVLLILWSIREIVREVKGAKASKIIASRIKESIKSNPLPGTPKISITDIDPKEAENTVTVVTEKSTSDLIWRTHAVKIVIGESGIDDNPNLEALLENHWEPFAYTNEGYMLLKQSIRKETIKVNPKPIPTDAPPLNLTLG